MVRFRASANPKPTKTVHNTPLEVAWTVIPILILVFIAIPSFRLLYEVGTIPQADMTIKTTSYQWYWSYEYPDHGDFIFDAYMVGDDDLEPGQPRLLATDYDVVLPVGKTIRVLVAADPAGVIHSWAVPSLGVKTDSIPGVSMRPGCGLINRGCITANVRNYAASITALCPLPSGRFPRRSSTPGFWRRKWNSPGLTLLRDSRDVAAVEMPGQGILAHNQAGQPVP